MPGVFISYRRRDTDGHAGRLAEDLRERYGADRVFIDVDSIGGGADFEQRIELALDSCDAAFVLIGEDWLGRRAGAPARIMDPDDWVRREVATVLRRPDVTVVPVLVEGAPLPTAADLPPDLERLPRLQAAELSTREWDYRVGQLCEVVERVEPDVAGGPLRRLVRRSGRAGAAAIAAVLAAAAVAIAAVVASGGDSGSKATCVNQTIPAASRAALTPAAGASGPALKGVYYGSCDGTPWAIAHFPGKVDGVFKRDGDRWRRLGSINDEQCSVPGELLDAWRLARCEK